MLGCLWCKLYVYEYNMVGSVLLSWVQTLCGLGTVSWEGYCLARLQTSCGLGTGTICWDGYSLGANCVWIGYWLAGVRADHRDFPLNHAHLASNHLAPIYYHVLQNKN